MLPDLIAYRATLSFDDADERTLEVYSVVVANGCYVAGGIPIAPRAKLDDGLLDSELLIFHQARKVKIAAEPGMWFNVDGELVGNQPTTFETLPRVLEVVVGEEA